MERDAAVNRLPLFALIAMGAVQASVPPPTMELPWVADAAQLARILEAEDRRVAAPELEVMAEDADPTLRARVALALARVGDPRSLSRLGLMASDAQASVRAMAAFAMGRLDYDLLISGGAVRVRARDLLIARLDDELEVAVQAGLALGAVDGGAMPAVGEALARPTIAPHLAAALLRSWWRLEGADVGVAARFAAHADPDVRLAAASALRRLNDPNAFPTLVEMLADAEPEVRLEAARGLAAAPIRVAEERGVPLLADLDRRLVCAVLVWLEQGWSGSGEAGDDAFEAVLRRSFDRALHVRRCALRALGAVAGSRAVAVDRLLEALGEPEPAVRAESANVLAEQGPEIVRVAVRRAFPDGQVTAPVLADLRARPLEEAALAKLVVAAAQPAMIEAWLEAADTDGRMTMLSALLPADAARVYQLAASMPLDDVAVLGLIGRAHRVAPAALPPAAISELTDKLWRGYFDTPIGDPRRHAALRALTAVDGDLVARRRELVYADGDRTIRDWAAQQWSDEGAGLPAAEILLAPHWTEREADDYVALADAVIDLYANFPIVTVETTRGVAVVELRPDWAPLTVVQFVDLIGSGYFDGSSFYRVIAGFVTQGGGTPGNARSPRLRNEDSPLPYARGVLGMALSGRDTGTTHFFVTHARQPHLRGAYPIFGRVLEGQRILERIQPGDRMQMRLGRPE
jgi:peptidyl-prolyl cis-trans isomerase B (cyclophilin B)